MNALNSTRGDSIRAAFASKRAPLIEQLKTLLVADSKLSASVAARQMGISRDLVRQCATDAGLKLARGPAGRPTGIIESGPRQQRKTPRPESVRLRAEAVIAQAAKKREGLTAQLREALQANKHATATQLAAQFKTTSYLVSRCLQEAGLRAKGEGTGDAAAAVEAYRAGASRRDACAAGGISPARLKRELKSAGIEMRKPVRNEKKRAFEVDAERGREVLARLASNGSRIESIAAQARFRVIRLDTGAVLSGGPSREICVRQCRVINTYSLIAEVRP